MKFLVAAIVAVASLSSAVAQKSPDNAYWKAVSKTAQAITGDITISGERMMMVFQPFTIADIRDLSAEEVAAAFNFETTDGVRGRMYRLSIPADRKLLHRNTLCGAEETQYMATAVQGKTMQVAFFSGAKMPSLKPEDMNNSTALCGTFSYQR